MSLREVLILVFGIAGLLWYYICLISIGLKPLAAGQTASSFREFMSLSVTTIGVSLATFVGMLLGVRSVSQSVQQTVQGTVTPQLQQLAQGTWTTSLQWWAAGLYVLSLLIAIVLWYRGGSTTDPTVSNLGKSLLGLIGGGLSIALNLPP